MTKIERTKQEQLAGLITSLKKSNHATTAIVIHDMVTKITTINLQLKISLLCNVIMLILYYGT